MRRYLLPIGLCLLLFIVAFVYMLPGTNQSVNIYDEGIIVYSAVRVMEGHVPYRDFWSIYSPGQFYGLAAAFSAFGTSIQTERLYDAFLRALVPLFAYLIAVRFTTRLKALVAYAAATAWLGFYAYSYFYQWTFFGYPAYPAIAFSLATIWMMSVYFTDPRRRWLVGSGFMLGITTLFRHDFGIYCGIGAFLALALYTLLRNGESRPTWRERAKTFWRMAWPFVLSAVIIVGPVLIYFVAQVKLSELVYDLFTFPASIFPRFRALPYPPNGPYGPKEFPQLLPFYLPFVVFLISGGLAFIIARRRTTADIAQALCIVMLIVFGLFAFNQARVRADVIHTPAFFIPSVILLVILLKGIPAPT
ncbi:MAG TPA: glycosyltransferase family 39 protein, partial [Anaerolineae bacterium]